MQAECMCAEKITNRKGTYSIMKTPNLTIQPPRSPRVRLGGFTILPRILDKARAQVAGTNGDYNYNSTLDSLFFGFVGIDPAALLDEVATSKTDGEILGWILGAATQKRSSWEICHWADWTQTFTVRDVGSRDWFTGEIKRLCPERSDIETIFDYLDVDDFVSFGGKA